MMWLFVILILLGSCSAPELDSAPFPLPNATIAEVRAMAEAGYREVESDIVIVGRVASSDSTGNIYRRVVVEDGTAGAELLTGFYDNYLFLPEGANIAIHLRGLAIDTKDGVLRIGTPADKGTSLAPQMFVSVALWRRYVSLGGSVERVAPAELLLGEPFDHLVGRLVCVRDVSLATPDSTTWGGRHLFCNPEGDSLWVTTNPYATFALNTIPHTPLTLQGILYRSGLVPLEIKNSTHESE
jgi:hypothetical protein